MGVKKLLAEDIEVASFRVKVDRAIQGLNPRKEMTRRRELHVSDFTASDEEFCARRILVRWWRGDSREFTTKVQHDGKFREQKWLGFFEQAGMLRDYQPTFRMGELVGHPDFVLDWGYGRCVVDLTGYDKTNDAVFRARHLAAKKRQVRLYNVMADARRGFVIYEDKASAEYKLVPVDRDERVERVMVERVAVVSFEVHTMGQDPLELDLLRAVRRMPKCQKKTCRWCAVQQDSDLFQSLEAVPDAAEAHQDDPGGVPVEPGMVAPGTQGEQP